MLLRLKAPHNYTNSLDFTYLLTYLPNYLPVLTHASVQLIIQQNNFTVMLFLPQPVTVSGYDMLHVKKGRQVKKIKTASKLTK